MNPYVWYDNVFRLLSVTGMVIGIILLPVIIEASAPNYLHRKIIRYTNRGRMEINIFSS